MKAQYPDAYCVKCKTHTPTNKKHTVMLSSSARAVTGECPKCGSAVYKILPNRSGSAAAAAAKAPRSNIVSLNHRSWIAPQSQMQNMQRSAAQAAAWPLHQSSFVLGVAAGVLIMLGVIVARVYF